MLSAREASPGALCSPAGIGFTKGMVKLERVQRKGRRTIRGLKTMTCEGRLNTVGLFALKRRLERRHDNSLPVYKMLHQKGREQSVFHAHDQKDKKKKLAAKTQVAY